MAWLHKFTATLALALLLAPTVAAATFDVRNYIAGTSLVRDPDGAFTNETFSVEVHHDFRLREQNTSYVIRAHYHLDSPSPAGGTLRFTASVDGVTLPGCAWTVKSGDVTGAQSGGSVTLACVGPALAPGIHNWTVEREQLDGFDVIQNSTTSLQIFQTEEVMLDNFSLLGYSTPESWTLVILLVLFALASWLGWWVTAFGAGTSALAVLIAVKTDAPFAWSDDAVLIALLFFVLDLFLMAALEGYRWSRTRFGDG